MYTVSPDLYREEPQPDGVCGACGFETYPLKGRAHHCGACGTYVAPAGACPDCREATSRCVCDSERSHASAYVAGLYGAAPRHVTPEMVRERAANGHPYLLKYL